MRSYLSLLNNIGVFLGATFGGWISVYLSDQLIIFGWHIVLRLHCKCYSYYLDY
jgi:hypothetical protein